MGVVEIRIHVIERAFVFIFRQRIRDQVVIYKTLGGKMILKSPVISDTKANRSSKRVFLVDIVIPSKVVVTKQPAVPRIGSLKIEGFTGRAIIVKRARELFVLKTAGGVVKRTSP